MNKAVQAWFNFRGGRNNLPWTARRGTREQLPAFFARVGLNIGVEVGTQRGVWAKALCDGHPALRLTCVDPWAAYSSHPQEQQDRFYAETVARLEGTGSTLLRMRSLDALPQFADRSLDFVYIDGAHDFDNAAADIIGWARKVRVGGIVAVHDYDLTDVRCAVDAYTRCHHIIPWYLTSDQHGTAFWVQR